VALPALRGGIYDRNGQTLALSIPTETVIADDFQIAHPFTEAEALAPLLGVPAAQLAPELHRASGYVSIATQLSQTQGQKVSAGNFAGITMIRAPGGWCPTERWRRRSSGSPMVRGSVRPASSTSTKSLWRERQGARRCSSRPSASRCPSPRSPQSTRGHRVPASS